MQKLYELTNSQLKVEIDRTEGLTDIYYGFCKGKSTIGDMQKESSKSNKR